MKSSFHRQAIQIKPYLRVTSAVRGQATRSGIPKMGANNYLRPPFNFAHGDGIKKTTTDLSRIFS
jgi:hypothetical protein